MVMRKGQKHSDGARKKMSEAHAGKKFSMETRKKLSEAHKGRRPFNYGKQLSQEHKDNISKGSKGKRTGDKNPMFGKTGEAHHSYGTHHSEATRKKISIATKGRKLSKEHRLKISKATAGVNNPMYGRKRNCSEETRRKMSEKLKGRIFTEEHKKKMGDARRGKKHSAETKKILSEKRKLYKTSNETKQKLSRALKGKFVGEKHPMWGKHHSEEARKKLSIAHKGKRTGNKNPMYGRNGDLNPNWKGGISCEPYCDAWADQEYKESIKERDGFQCQNPECWGKDTMLTVHHINYIKKDCHPDNLITLCRSCNSRANTNRDYWSSLYQGMRKKVA